MNKFYKFLRLPWRTRWVLVEAFCLLAVARAASYWLPFRFLRPYLGVAQREERGGVSPAQQYTLQQVGWVVRGVSRYTPWTSNCMAQAMTGKWMLRRRGIPSTLYVGVCKMDERFAGHAWLCAGEEIITGGGTLERYKAVAHFGEGYGSR